METVGESYIEAETGWKRYEESNSSIGLSEAWMSATRSAYSGGGNQVLKQGRRRNKS